MNGIELKIKGSATSRQSRSAIRDIISMCDHYLELKTLLYSNELKEGNYMDYDLKIRQSYHGTGGKEGYRFKLYNNKGKKLGELKDVPVDCNCGNIVSINGTLYSIERLYDSPNPREERSEVIYYELKKFEFKPDFNLGEVIRKI